MNKKSFFNILNLFRKDRKMYKNGNRKYIVGVDDNYHYLDESERYNAACFNTYEDAVEYCKALVDKELMHLFRPGMTAEVLYDYYMDFGEDPFIRTDEDIENYFSAWDYAKEKSKEICKFE